MVRSEVWEGRRRRATAAQAACRGGLDCRFGVRHGVERTRNMPPMFVTLEVSKLSGWLNADAWVNMSPMALTLDVSKLSGWLKDDAKANMPFMVVTLEVSQLDTSALNVDRHGESSNVDMRLDMSVTALTSHPPIGPYTASVAAWSAQYMASLALRSLLLWLLLDDNGHGARHCNP